MKVKRSFAVICDMINRGLEWCSGNLERTVFAMWVMFELVGAIVLSFAIPIGNIAFDFSARDNAKLVIAAHFPLVVLFLLYTVWKLESI